MHALSLTLPLWVWVALREMADKNGLTVSAEIRVILANEVRRTGRSEHHSSEKVVEASNDDVLNGGRTEKTSVPGKPPAE